MHQHVQAQRFLLAHAARNLSLHRRLVSSFVQFTETELASGLADLYRLREGADGCRRVSRQLQQGGLLRCTLFIRADALAQRSVDPGDGCLDQRIVHTGGSAPFFNCRIVRYEGFLYGHASVVQGLGQDVQFIQLLQRKGQPGSNLGIQFLFAIQIDRHVQQGAGWCDPQTVLQCSVNRLQPFERGMQVGFPDIAAINHTKGQHCIRRQLLNDLRHFGASIDGIDMQTLYRQLARQSEVVLQLAEISGQQQFDLARI